MHLQLALHAVGRDRAGPHDDAVGSVIAGGYGRAGRDDELDAARQPPIGVEIGRGGQHVVPKGVADCELQRVVGAETDEVGHLESEGRAASAVLACVPAIDEKVGDGFGAVAADEESSALPGTRILRT